MNELRGGINYQNLYRRANLETGQWMSSVGFNDSEINSYGSVVGPSLIDTPGQVAFVFGGFPGIPNGGRNTDRPMDQRLATFGDTISWTTGKHSIRAGADIVRNQAVDGFALNRNNPRGTVNYAANLGGFANFYWVSLRQVFRTCVTLTGIRCIELGAGLLCQRRLQDSIGSR